ncbi:hypothetical protein OIU77_022215 [Salix suchowensis]|uniref:Cytochrome oxidase subunit II transmembrane region profile domain-containing protein n=1 Tax=Salix suchowensis TaxID=1278906 RepID=A0ABQ9BZF7_9ROSI|nr:hypothetical protein OIU77_022215 [Salix suchowensis]
MAIRISRRSKPHDARNNGFTSPYLILPHSYFGFRIMDLGWRLWHFHYKKNPIPQRTVHGTTIEILWIIFPSLILMFIAIPSFALLFAMDDVVAGGKRFVGGFLANGQQELDLRVAVSGTALQNSSSGPVSAG